VDSYATLLRASAANTGNDHRLGANEAPPAIVSVFLGDMLTEIMEKLSKGETVNVRNGEQLEIGVNTLPRLPKHLTDRNRTSPFAFTGNKFEFRMVASSQSIAEPNTVLNTAVAEVLREFADELEGSSDVNETIKRLVKETYKQHERVVFNGNGYSDEWVREAEQRGLPNIATTVDAIGEFTTEEAVGLFSEHCVYSRQELVSRKEIGYENYSKQVAIEANVTLSMGRTAILPAGTRYAETLARTITSIKETSPELDTSHYAALLEKVLDATRRLDAAAAELDELLRRAREMEEGSYEQARFFRYEVFDTMNELRAAGDELETAVPADLWPLPTYEQMLFQL
jgi:glutamine synthetase